MSYKDRTKEKRKHYVSVSVTSSEQNTVLYKYLRIHWKPFTKLILRNYAEKYLCSWEAALCRPKNKDFANRHTQV